LKIFSLSFLICTQECKSFCIYIGKVQLLIFCSNHLS
jgi:hypothetical protein